MPKPPAAPETVQLRYAQLEELVASLLEAHDDRKSPLSARFRLFRQRGFPPNVTTLSKTRFAYSLDATMRVALAFWLMDAFIPQEVVPLVIERDWDKLRAAFGDALQRIRADGRDTAAVDDDRQVLLVTPRNLHGFTLAKDEKADPADVVGIEIMSAWDARERMFGDERRDAFAPVTVIDIHRLAAWVQDYILRSHWAGQEPFDAFAAG